MKGRGLGEVRRKRRDAAEVWRMKGSMREVSGWEVLGLELREWSAFGLGFGGLSEYLVEFGWWGCEQEYGVALAGPLKR